MQIQKETEYGKLALGIDIGTSTISSTVIDIDSKSQIRVYNIENNCHIDSEVDFSLQDADKIAEKALELVDQILREYGKVQCIGVTGQMHGIVYLDEHGNAVSDLMTWQDKRCDRELVNGMTYCDSIRELTNKSIYTGYGLATHYYNVKNNFVPSSAKKFSSIMDYIVMKLCDLNEPLVHSSVADSFGLFDSDSCSFMSQKIELLNMDDILFPKVTDNSVICGKYREIPVSIAIGDNQAAFLGSVKDINDCLLINLGTGSQASIAVEPHESMPERGSLECRPFIMGKKLLCGAALCGGEAYAILENFFRQYLADTNPTSQYEVMNKIAESAYKEKVKPLRVNTQFCGSRSDKQLTGSILNITKESFTPKALILGVLYGMVEELYNFGLSDMFKRSYIVASGNAIQKNTVLCEILKERFDMPLKISKIKEEAAVGAALFSALCTGYISDLDEISEYIKY